MTPDPRNPTPGIRPPESDPQNPIPRIGYQNTVSSPALYIIQHPVNDRVALQGDPRNDPPRDDDGRNPLEPIPLELRNILINEILDTR